MARRKLTDLQKLEAKIKREALQDAMAYQLRVVGLKPPEAEYAFAGDIGGWLFDFAWPAERVALEVEGGTWTGGRHVRPEGFEEDSIKYAVAAIGGWRLVRVTADMIEDGRALYLVESILKGRTIGELDRSIVRMKPKKGKTYGQ